MEQKREAEGVTGMLAQLLEQACSDLGSHKAKVTEIQPSFLI